MSKPRNTPEAIAASLVRSADTLDHIAKQPHNIPAGWSKELVRHAAKMRTEAKDVLSGKITPIRAVILRTMRLQVVELARLGKMAVRQERMTESEGKAREKKRRAAAKKED